MTSVRQPYSVEPPAPPVPLQTRVGTLFGAATLAALLGSIPATVRVASPAVGFLSAWFGLGACALPPLVVIVFVLRATRESARVIVGEDGSITGWALLVWALGTFVTLSAFGAVLRATTHHHALAGVTFALGAVAVAGFAALLARRLASIARALGPAARAVMMVAVLGTLTGILFVLAARVARAGGLGTPPPEFVDVLAFAISAGALSRRAFASVPWLARSGVPLALGVLVLGGALLVRDGGLVAALKAHAPLFAPLAELVASR
jgi:hypothetical protein